MIIPSPPRALTRAVAFMAALGGSAVALYYAQLGLTLTHYDARGHLIVARRIVDSITPGWQQIGAVWLPLPHLLNALPVQIDLFYRSGASGVAISIASFSLACACIAWWVATISESTWCAVAATAIFAFNPNVLYLQATPMTEPLLLALTLLAVGLLFRWTLDDGSAQTTGGALALVCLTRYEAWPVALSALGTALIVRMRREPWKAAVARVFTVAVYPGGAIIAFLVFSRIVGGSWLVADFFVPENPAFGKPYESLSQIAWGTSALSHTLLVAIAGTGIGALLVRSVRDGAQWLLPLTLTATSAVPFLAFVDGHPYRIRYMVPLIAAQAVCAGAAAVWLPRRFRAAAGVALIGLAATVLRPLDLNAPMVREAQWDRPNIVARDEAVTPCLARDYDGTTIMASMGSLGHYMQDLSRAGFALRNFLHEGNGDIWLNGLDQARPYAGWILIEEKAEGGDMLARNARENPRFLAGFSRVCEGAGLALYRRHPAGNARSVTNATQSRLETP